MNTCSNPLCAKQYTRTARPSKFCSDTCRWHHNNKRWHRNEKRILAVIRAGGVPDYNAGKRDKLFPTWLTS